MAAFRSFLAAAVIVGCSHAHALTFEHELGVELKRFNHVAPEPQSRGSLSVVYEGELYHEWQGGDIRLTLSPFLRLNTPDTDRSHADLREANIMVLKGDWQFQFGLGKEFWGATESIHLVDIINQTDLIENVDGEDKFGQPMVKVAWLNRLGTLEAFVLPGFRERSFPSADGRLRAALPVDTDNPIYESHRGDKHVDVALRFAGSLGSVDYGVAHFSGTNREPRLVLDTSNPLQPRLRPRYEQIDQLSIDMSGAFGGWLIKAEAFYRRDDLESFIAAAVGFEYTFVGLFGTAIDYGLLVEYLYDGRDHGIAQMDNDWFFGGRFALNDAQSSELLFGLIFDRETSERFFFLEANRRIGNDAQVALEYRGFTGFKANGPTGLLNRDDYWQLEWRLFF